MQGSLLLISLLLHQVEKVRCITTKRTSLRQQNKLSLPVLLESSVTEETDDELWITEVERYLIKLFEL